MSKTLTAVFIDGTQVVEPSCEVLKQAEKIARRKNVWCKGSIAQTKDGDEIYGPEPVETDADITYPKSYSNDFEAVTDPRAAQFCAVGLLARARVELGMPLPTKSQVLPEQGYLDELMEEIENQHIAKQDEDLDYDTESLFRGYTEVVDFNDAGSTTLTEVIGLFRHGIKQLCK